MRYEKACFSPPSLFLYFIHRDQHHNISVPRPTFWVISSSAVKTLTHIPWGCGYPARFDIRQILNKSYLNKSKLNASLQNALNHLHGFGRMYCAQSLCNSVTHHATEGSVHCSLDARLYWTSLLITRWVRFYWKTTLIHGLFTVTSVYGQHFYMLSHLRGSKVCYCCIILLCDIILLHWALYVWLCTVRCSSEKSHVLEH